MNKLNLLLIILFGFTVLSCSSDNDEPNNTSPEQTEKKLIKITEEDNYGVYKNIYIYNSENKVIEIESSFTEFGQNIPDDIHSIIFTYENDLVISATEYENDELYLTIEYNYVNDKLAEKISYTSNGTEDEKMEFFYNVNGELNGFIFYVEGILQQEVSYVYSNGNVTISEDNYDHSEISHDTKPTPYSNFTDTNKIIFGQLLIQSLSDNNIVNEIRTYNVGNSNESIRNYETTITYDSDNYPTTKIVTETYNSNTTTISTTTFEYE
ncbi:hypothetical protein [Xanthomarina sp. GH4-25]|uniref:hypothetical protein n=1 Tax=Xanthomarina sp. GH4-25 TaxID=3349335 RepID=UPI0038780043